MRLMWHVVFCRLFLILAAISTIGFALLIAYLYFWDFDFGEKDLDAFLNHHMPLLTEILDYHGDPIIELPGLDGTEARTPYYRRWVDFQNIPEVVLKAELAAEDQRFFEHHGIDWIAIIRAAKTVVVQSVWTSVRSGRPTIVFAEGASTITQQAVRLFFLHDQVSREQTGRVSHREKISRKLREIRMSLWLERGLAHRLGRAGAKETIFEVFVNISYIGNGRYGIAASAEFYFGKSLDELLPEEAAMLAGLVRDPSYYSPMISHQHALERRNQILDLMAKLGFLTASESRSCMRRPIALAPIPKEKIIAPAVVHHVLTELKPHPSRRISWGNGLVIQTTIRKDWQRIANIALEVGLNEYRARHPEYAQKIEGAVVVLSNTGEIRALVGGTSVNYTAFDHTEALRQPGSAFKPFVYTAALENGWHMNCDDGSLRECCTANDAPVAISMGRHRLRHHVGNYDGRFYGIIPLWLAIAESRNAPTVRLARKVGLGHVVEVAERLGLNKKIEMYPTTAIGAEEVTPLELAGAYATFANGGFRVAPWILKSVSDESGRTLLSVQPTEGVRVLDQDVEREILEGLRHTITWKHGTGKRLRELPFPVGGKTGTTNDFRDAWFCGFTYGKSGVTIVVWIGMDDRTPIGDGARCRPLSPTLKDFCEPGGRVALPIFEMIVEQIYENTPPNPFPDDVEATVRRTEKSAWHSR